MLPGDADVHGDEGSNSTAGTTSHTVQAPA
jgi:hypothetical protein